MLWPHTAHVQNQQTTSSTNKHGRQTILEFPFLSFGHFFAITPNGNANKHNFWKQFTLKTPLPLFFVFLIIVVCMLLSLAKTMQWTFVSFMTIKYFAHLFLYVIYEEIHLVWQLINLSRSKKTINTNEITALHRELCCTAPIRMK